MFLDIFNELLAEAKLNRKQFAEQSEIPYTTVIGWTNLNRLPDYTALIKIADFFHCSIDYLTGRQENYGNTYSSVEVSKPEQILLKNFRNLDTDDRELLLTLSKKLSRKSSEG